MRLIATSILVVFSIVGFAQNVWEKPVQNTTKTVEEVVKPNPDEKYLAGAVAEEDGKVQWTLDIDVPGKSAEQIYDKMYRCLDDLTKQENQLEGSCVALVNKKDHIIVATIREWLVFKDSFLSLDRSKFNYTLIAECKDNHLTLKMNRIYYKYEEDRKPQGGGVYKAEDWISDAKALNKKQTKLLPGSAKFRRKTIDRKDFLFENIERIVKE